MPDVNFYNQSRARGAHADLFEFIYGEGENDYYAYTNHTRTLALAGKDYTPAAISAGDFTNKGRDKGTPLTISAASSLEICQLFRGIVPRRRIFFRLYAGAVPDSESPSAWSESATFNLIFSGRVIEANRKKAQTELSCDTLGAGMKRPGLNRFYQRECSHVLYGPRCQASKVDATYSTTVVSAAGRSIELTGGWNGAVAAASFIGGTVEWAGDYGTEVRQIVDIDGDVLTVDTPIVDLEATDDIDAVLGCPRHLTACADLHDNIVNFGGFPYIPLLNPLGKNNHT